MKTPQEKATGPGSEPTTFFLWGDISKDSTTLSPNFFKNKFLIVGNHDDTLDLTWIQHFIDIEGEKKLTLIN